jgi:anti-anti-sigma factor
MPAHDLRVETQEGAGVVTLVGEHDAYGSDRLRRELEQLLAVGTPIVIDLSEATSIDSVTVGVLLAARRAGAASGVSLELVLPTTPGSEYVRRLIETTQLDAVFPIHASLAAALAAKRMH